MMMMMMVRMMMLMLLMMMMMMMMSVTMMTARMMLIMMMRTMMIRTYAVTYVRTYGNDEEDDGDGGGDDADDCWHHREYASGLTVPKSSEKIIAGSYWYLCTVPPCQQLLDTDATPALHFDRWLGAFFLRVLQVLPFPFCSALEVICLGGGSHYN